MSSHCEYSLRISPGGISYLYVCIVRAAQISKKDLRRRCSRLRCMNNVLRNHYDQRKVVIFVLVAVIWNAGEILCPA